jgi:hypothetical protein
VTLAMPPTPAQQEYWLLKRHSARRWHLLMSRQALGLHRRSTSVRRQLLLMWTIPHLPKSVDPLQKHTAVNAEKYEIGKSSTNVVQGISNKIERNERMLRSSLLKP